MDALEGRFAARQISGDRDYQEDEFGLLTDELKSGNNEDSLIVLCDGMGGAVAGATASSIVVREFLESYRTSSKLGSERLLTALHKANGGLVDEIKSDPSKRGMGCTLIGASITKAGLEWASVGDSLLYLFRGGQLYRLNEDHSLAPMLEKLVATGRMTAEEAENDPQRHALRSALTGEDISLIDQKGPLALKQTDILLIASDGIETLSIQQIVQILKETKKRPISESVQALIDAVEVEKKPHQDNTTIILFRPKGDWGDSKSSIILPMAAGQTKPLRARLQEHAGRLWKPTAMFIMLAAILAALLTTGVISKLTDWSPLNNGPQPPPAPAIKKSVPAKPKLQLKPLTKVERLLQAARRGEENAQIDLARLYFDGRGINQDFKQAYIWSALASLQQNDFATQFMNKIKAQLSPRELREANDEIGRRWDEIQGEQDGERR